MIWLAFRLTLHNRTRLVVTLFGVVFSSYLTLTEVALYIGMMENATSLIRHSRADVWVASRGIRNFDFAKLFPEDRMKQIVSLPDVAWAKRIMLTWGFLKLPDGAQEQVEIIGYDPNDPVGGPWEMAEGRPDVVADGAKIILDESTGQRLGSLVLGSTWEVNDQKVRLSGLSRSVKTFTTAPVVFTSYSFAQAVSSDIAREASTAFIAIKLRDVKATGRVVSHLHEVLRDNDVMSTRQFIKRTIYYWTAETGMGAAFCLTAILGLVVGAGVIGQNVSANTMEHLAELATLKAMGASNAAIDTIIVGQAFIDALGGYLIATVLAFMSRPILEEHGVSLAFHPSLVAGLLIFILTVSGAVALFSVRRVRRLDPAIVFRG